MTVARETLAKVQAEWKSPSAVGPSPHHAAAIRVSPLAALAMAQPTACGYCVARFPEIEKKLASLLEYMIGNCLPCNRSARRSEEHTSELQSLMRISYAVFCLTKK